jgi:hypothetical protein
LDVSDFFEPPPPAPPEPEPPPTPPWFGAPRGMLPGVVAAELVLARTGEVAVCITRLAAYTTGFEFEIRTLAAPGGRDLDLDPMLFGPHRHRLRRPGSGQALPDEMLRFGVQFADGGKATNTGGFHLARIRRQVPSCTGAVVAAGEATGVRANGCGRCRHPDRSRSSADGQPRGFLSRARRLTLRSSLTPLHAHGPFSPMIAGRVDRAVGVRPRLRARRDRARPAPRSRRPHSLGLIGRPESRQSNRELESAAEAKAIIRSPSART